MDKGGSRYHHHQDISNAAQNASQADHCPKAKNAMARKILAASIPSVVLKPDRAYSHPAQTEPAKSYRTYLMTAHQRSNNIPLVGKNDGSRLKRHSNFGIAHHRACH
ncbi:hypothetical protein H4P12_03035 [Paracoccus sp. 11-3]|uniref:Uncharacterized protein n=1 Tax=Paracoccus amoyensis TaxID=2760093 RepID=A0A926JCE7_9RHOB|nr:hypothetical protein [Paracoccus amoyensis]MBC9245708.1 hypothetical protein [Paracoccus amoyensis]